MCNVTEIKYFNMFAAVKSKLITIKLKPTYLNGHNFEIKLKCATFIRCEERQEGI